MLFLILGAVVLVAAAVIGILFFLLNKEGEKSEEEKAITLKKDMVSELLEPQKPKSETHEAVAPYPDKVALPAVAPLAVTPAQDETYKKHAQELEDELKNISQKAESQSSEAKQMILTLTQENESLKKEKASLQEAQQTLTQLQTEASDLKNENTGLQKQLEATNTKLRLFEEEMAAVKLQMGDEITRAKATVAQLTQEKEMLVSNQKTGHEEALHQELESMKSEQVQLKQKYEDLDRTYQKLRELNNHLIEKNDMLQYELIKARAQASGLERVSYNYKNQLEDSFKKFNAAQVTNDHLAQVKNRLEGMVEEIKSQNEELAKKDQLAQFELEKSRSRLASLERECEELKTRGGQHKDQP